MTFILGVATGVGVAAVVGVVGAGILAYSWSKDWDRIWGWG